MQGRRQGDTNMQAASRSRNDSRSRGGGERRGERRDERRGDSNPKLENGDRRYDSYLELDREGSQLSDGLRQQQNTNMHRDRRAAGHGGAHHGGRERGADHYDQPHELEDNVPSTIDCMGMTGPDAGNGDRYQGYKPMGVASSGSKPPRQLSKDARSPRDTLKDGKEVLYGGFDYDLWLESAEAGELCVYTCLGLSDAMSWTPDTRALLFKIVACLFMQLGVPLMLLLMELDVQRNELENDGEGVSWSIKAQNSEDKFRLVGAAMLLYSLYVMYDGCMDECRSAWLYFALEHRLHWGLVWPSLVGEFANIFVGMLLVVTMFMCFNNIHNGTNLVLNAVALNFLAGVDSEFVDRETYDIALLNFKHTTEKFRHCRPKDAYKCWSRIVWGLMFILRYSFVILGVVLGVAFGVLPGRSDESNTFHLPFKFSYHAWWLH